MNRVHPTPSVLYDISSAFKMYLLNAFLLIFMLWAIIHIFKTFVLSLLLRSHQWLNFVIIELSIVLLQGADNNNLPL